MADPTYHLVITKEGPAIKCLMCGRISYHAGDIKERFCGACHVFHADRRFRKERREHG